MKHITYLALVLFGFIFSGCGDINEFTPTVSNPDVEWKLLYVTSPSPTYYQSTVDYPEKFTYTIDENSRTIQFKHTVHNDKRAVLKPTVTVLNTSYGVVIDLLYKETTNTINNNAVVVSATTFTHNFNYSQKGGGIYKNIIVKTRFEYPTAGFYVWQYTQDDRTISF